MIQICPLSLAAPGYKVLHREIQGFKVPRADHPFPQHLSTVGSNYAIFSHSPCFSLKPQPEEDVRRYLSKKIIWLKIPVKHATLILNFIFFWVELRFIRLTKFHHPSQTLFLLSVKSCMETTLLARTPPKFPESSWLLTVNGHADEVGRIQKIFCGLFLCVKEVWKLIPQFNPHNQCLTRPCFFTERWKFNWVNWPS